MAQYSDRLCSGPLYPFDQIIDRGNDESPPDTADSSTYPLGPLVDLDVYQYFDHMETPLTLPVDDFWDDLNFLGVDENQTSHEPIVPETTLLNAPNVHFLE